MYLDEIKFKLKEYMEAYSKIWDTSCAVLVAKDEEILFCDAYGYANLEHRVPNTVYTKFWIASITKLFTSAAVMILQEQGFLKVSDPIIKFLEDYPCFDERITIHHLLTHSSGIVNYSALSDWEDVIQKQYYNEADFIDIFKDMPLEFEPGTGRSYSNSGYYLLGIIVERVSGQAFEEFVRENIINKAGLTNTGFIREYEVISHMASGYEYNGPVLVKGHFSEMTKIWPSGGIYSTVEDLYKWNKALHRGMFVSDISLSQMFTDHGNNYGYGTDVFKKYNRKAVGHNGYYCGFLTQYYYYPDEGVFVCILSNNSYMNVWRLCDELAAIALEEPSRLPVKPRAAGKNLESFDRFLGIYDNGAGLAIRIFKDEDRFQLRFNRDNAFTIYPISDNVFCNELLDEQYIFETNESGELSLWGCIKRH
ncbi:MAG: serine hydrolase domain-containing protein [Bacillota bacterium]|nr:serine hydrolase domain-containing protein [Bacillota bacterium]